MASASRPAEVAVPAVGECCEKGGGARFGLTLVVFEEILEQVATKYVCGGTSVQKVQLWRELRVEELVLARGCAAGHNQAWTEFLGRYREKLYDIARRITKEDSSARELADSLYAHLYCTSEPQGRRPSPLRSYKGRGAFEGRLAAVFAQGVGYRYRKNKR